MTRVAEPPLTAADVADLLRRNHGRLSVRVCESWLALEAENERLRATIDLLAVHWPKKANC